MTWKTAAYMAAIVVVVLILLRKIPTIGNVVNSI